MSKEYQHILEGAMTLPRNELFALMQAILIRIEEGDTSNDGTWEPTELQKQKLDALSKRIRNGERGKSWADVRASIAENNGI